MVFTFQLAFYTEFAYKMLILVFFNEPILILVIFLTSLNIELFL